MRRYCTMGMGQALGLPYSRAGGRAMSDVAEEKSVGSSVRACGGYGK